MIIKYIRTLFCKHDFEHIRHVTFYTGEVDAFMCKKCGWIRKIKTQL